MSTITWEWDGSAVARTTALGAEWTVDDYFVSPARAVTDHKRVDLLDALIDNTETTLDPVRDWRLVIRADVSGISAANTRRKLYAGWEELVTAFDPTQGVKKLEATRKDTSGTDVARHLLAEIGEVPSLQIHTADPRGLAESGAYDGEDGYIIYVVRGTTVFPYWVDADLLDQDTAPADAELNIGASPDTVTIDNAGARWVGVRALVGSVSGSVTQWSISNAANSDLLTVSNAGPFANGDYVDMLATDPRKIDRADSANKFTGGGINRLRLDKGSQVLTGSRLAGTGTLTLSLSWPKLSLTL